MKTLILIAVRNVRIHWRQSLFALLALIFGYLSLALFQGYMQDVGRMYEDTSIQRVMWGHFFIEHKEARERSNLEDPFKHSLEPAVQAQVKRLLEGEHRIDAAARFLFLSGSVSNGSNSQNFMGYGYDLDEGARIRSVAWAWDALAGEPLDRSQRTDVFLSGKGLAKNLGCLAVAKVKYLNGLDGFEPQVRPFKCDGDHFQLSTLTESGQANSLSLKLIGITDALYQEIDERFVSMSLDQAQSLLNSKKIHRYSVSLKDKQETSSTKERV